MTRETFDTVPYSGGVWPLTVLLYIIILQRSKNNIEARDIKHMAPWFEATNICKLLNAVRENGYIKFLFKLGILSIY